MESLVERKRVLNPITCKLQFSQSEYKEIDRTARLLNKRVENTIVEAVSFYKKFIKDQEKEEASSPVNTKTQRLLDARRKLQKLASGN